MQVRDDSICTLGGDHALVDQEVDLTAKPLTVYSKDSAFPWGHEVDGSRLFWIMWIENLQ